LTAASRQTVGAILMVHLKNGWSGVSPEQCVEFQLFIFAAALYFMVKGNDAN